MFSWVKHTVRQLDPSPSFSSPYCERPWARGRWEPVGHYSILDLLVLSTLWDRTKSQHEQIDTFWKMKVYSSLHISLRNVFVSVLVELCQQINSDLPWLQDEIWNLQSHHLHQSPFYKQHILLLSFSVFCSLLTYKTHQHSMAEDKLAKEDLIHHIREGT